MSNLNRIAENNLLTSGSFTHAIGVDEAGRGPLAGPVVCAAFLLLDNNIHSTALVADSKAMTEAQREESYELLIKQTNIIYATSIISHIEIDEINILQASLLGMRRATESVLAQLHARKDLTTNNIRCKALIDGNKIPANMPIESQYVIKGDSFIYSIAAASILAKVERDRLMRAYDLTYPLYNFAQHKGYPTFQHRTLLIQHGPCEIHRRSYGPVKQAIERMSSLTGQSTNSSCSSGVVVAESAHKSDSISVAVEVAKKRGTRKRKTKDELELVDDSETLPAAKKSRQRSKDVEPDAKPSSSKPTTTTTMSTTTTTSRKVSVVIDGNNNTSGTSRRSTRLVQNNTISNNK